LDMLNHGTTPVMSPICGGEDGVVYNVNADHVAEALALALAADALVFVSNVPGVQIDGQLVEHLAPSDVEQLIDQGIISGGMIPKTRSALGAVSRGVTAVRITNLQGLASGTGTVIS
jgi:acetylglutamate kinase